MPRTQHEIVRQGYQVLVDALGVADALRFIQHFSHGQGDYTQSRQTQLRATPLEDILSDMRQRQAESTSQYDEVIE